jgi:WD40 repeat protein
MVAFLRLDFCAARTAVPWIALAKSFTLKAIKKALETLLKLERGGGMTEDEVVTLLQDILSPQPLNQVQVAVVKQTWQGHSYMEIAKTADYDYGYVKDVGADLWKRLSGILGYKVSKQNLQVVLKRYAQNRPADIAAVMPGAAPSALPSPPQPAHYQDWGEAVDTSIFFGRTQELATLKAWIGQEHSRLVALVGMGGIGKTTLATKLAETLQADFTHLVWRSLRDAPPLEILLPSLLQFIANAQLSQIPASIGEQLSLLIDLLRHKRCLIILDNFEAILQPHQIAGIYREGYASYGQLLQRLGEVAHQGCLVLTSREKPPEIAMLEGPAFPVRSLLLSGLDPEAGKQLLAAKGLTGLDAHAERLLTYYQGNPLSLKIAATTVQDLAGGQVDSYFTQGMTLFSRVARLLEQQIQRLSPAEQQVMYWLATHRQPVSLRELEIALRPHLSQHSLAELVESLRWRSLIECSSQGMTQQPVVMELMIHHWLQLIAQEIIDLRPHYFYQLPLLEATTKDYIRVSQGRVVLTPLLERLDQQFGSATALNAQLQALLDLVQATSPMTGSYAGGNLLNLWRQMQVDLRGYDLSGLHIRQAYLQDVSLHQVNLSKAVFEQCVFAETFGSVTSLDFSHNGQRLATGDAQGAIQIWDVTRQQLVAQLNGHNSWIWSVKFSPDQRLLASCGQDQSIRLWDADKQCCLNMLTGHRGIVTCLMFSPTGQMLASCGYDQTIRLWDVNTGDCLQTLTGHRACIWSLAFTPDGQSLLSGSEDKTLRVWDVASGNCRLDIEAHQAWVKSVAVSACGQFCVSGGFDQTVKLWSLTTGACLQTWQGHIGPITGVAISPDGQTIASASYDQTIRLWQRQSGDCLKVLQKHTNLLWCLAFHPSGEWLASGGDDNRAILWELSSGEPIHTRQGHSNCIYALSLNHDHTLLATGQEDQTIHLWQLPQLTAPSSRPLTVSQPSQILRGHTGRVLSIASHPHDHLLASGGTDRTIRLWHPNDGRPTQVLMGHKSWIWKVIFSPNGQLLASASYDHTVRIWNVQSGKCLQVLAGHPSSVLSVSFNPSGTQLVSSGYERSICIWDVVTGQCLHTWQGHQDRIWAAIFIPSTSWIATGGDDHHIHLWDSQTQACIQTLVGHTDQVLALSYHADLGLLISGSADATLKVWHLQTGKCLHTLAGHHSWVWSSLLAPDQKTLLSGSQDETLKAWDLATGKCLNTLRSPRPYEGMDITGARGLTESQRNTLRALGAVD